MLTHHVTPAKHIVLVSGFGYQFAGYGNKIFVMSHFIRNVPNTAPNMLCNGPTHYKKKLQKSDTLQRICGALQKLVPVTRKLGPETSTTTFHSLVQC